MGPLKKRDFYLAQDIMDRFGISKKTLFNWEKEGRISRVPRDWRGWRMYNEKHLQQIKQVIEEKKRMAMSNVKRYKS